jgi:hypothetical protein
VSHDVVGESDIPQAHPRGGAVLISRRQHDGVAVLTGLPDVLENVSFNLDVFGIFQLEDILHRPLRA